MNKNNEDVKESSDDEVTFKCELIAQFKRDFCFNRKLMKLNPKKS
jgi:hypothetical protein